MGCCKCNGFFTRWPDPQEPVYEDEAGLQYCLFHAPANEKRSTLNGPILSEQEFQQIVIKRIRSAYEDKAAECDFREAIFPYMFSFSQFRSRKQSMKMRFEGCEFFDALMLDKVDSTVEILFSCAKFHGNVTIWRSNFSGKIDFSGAKYGQGLRIGHTKFITAVDLRDIECAEKPIVINDISEQSLSNIIFYSTIVKHMLFCGINQWPHELGLHKHITPPTSIKDLEELYRAMKQRALEQHDQPQASHWHFREKLMFKKQSWCRRWLPITLTWWYWATSGFGERAVRAGVWLAALLVLPFLANSPIGAWFSFLLSSLWSAIPGTAHVDGFAAAIRDSIDATTAVGFIPFMKETNGAGGWTKVGQALWQALIALQFTLFALAVRNRFRR